MPPTRPSHHQNLPLRRGFHEDGEGLTLRGWGGDKALDHGRPLLQGKKTRVLVSFDIPQI